MPGTEVVYWLTQRTTRKWPSHGTSMRNMDIAFVQRLLMSDAGSFQCCSGVSIGFVTDGVN
jgi:hypothetical protein